MDVFISYDSRDYKVAEDVANQLRNEGLNVWLDEQELFPGDNWAAAIGDALERADAMVVLLTQNSTSSKQVANEVSYAVGAPRFKGRLIPVLVEDGGLEFEEIRPWILRKFPVIKLSKTDPKQAISEITESLSDHVAA